MINDDYQTAIDYFANEIVKRINRNKTMDREERESHMTDDLDAFCEDIVGEVSKRMGWGQ